MVGDVQDLKKLANLTYFSVRTRFFLGLLLLFEKRFYDEGF